MYGDMIGKVKVPIIQDVNLIIHLIYQGFKEIAKHCQLLLESNFGQSGTFVWNCELPFPDSMEQMLQKIFLVTQDETETTLKEWCHDSLQRSRLGFYQLRGTETSVPEIP